MQLPDAIGLKGGESLAFVGAGGKTSAMFALAKALELPAVLTTTTHLGAWQANLADIHYILMVPEDIQKVDLSHPGIILITGPAGADNRLAGLQDEPLSTLNKACKDAGIPLLIEGDGARQLNLKAPAAYEPLIPEWVDVVVVMAGLKGLGKPLDAEVVHQPEIFSNLSGCAMGSLIESKHLWAVLSSKKGGLKNIPASARAILFLNQAEGNYLQGLGSRLARDLVDTYDSVLVGSLNETRQTGPIYSNYSRTAGVILAAGGSERLGCPKQLLDWSGKPFIRQIALNALEAGLAPLIVVTGEAHGLITPVLSDLPLKCVENPEWRAGQSTSMRVGLAALAKDVDSALFLLSDQPQIDAHLIWQILERYAQNRKPITAPMIRGQRGNPILFSKETFHALGKVEGDRGGRAIFNQFEVDWLPWADDRILMDVDEEGDYDRLVEAYFSS